MVLDRSNTRRFYIMGSPFDTARPRYDLHVMTMSQVFATPESKLLGEFAGSGGVLVAPAQVPGLGKPMRTWLNTQGQGTCIYVSDDVRMNLQTGDP